MEARNKKSLAAVVGAGVAAALLTITPQWEGTKLKTYRDIGGVLTYCTGATENAQWGNTYTPAQCREQLDRDLTKHAEGIQKCLKWDALTDGQKTAFVDTAYNIGVQAFCSSSMARLANQGDVRGSCDALMRWVYVGGKQVQGLINRRTAVKKICEGS